MANAARMTMVLGSTQSWQVTAQYERKPVTNLFVSGDILDASVYRGDGAESVFSPAVAWIDSAAGTVKVTVTDAQLNTAAVSPGLYRMEVGATTGSDGRRHLIYYGTIQFLGTKGSTGVPDSLCTWQDVLNYSSDVAKLEQQDVDQTQFAGQRHKAMSLFIQEVGRRYNPRPGGSRRYLSLDGTTAGPYLRYSPSPDGSQPPTRAQVEAWIADPARLSLNEDIVEANARLTAALVYGGTPGSNNPYQQMADKERALARAAIARAVIEIDTKDTPDGSPTIRVDRDVVYLT